MNVVLSKENYHVNNIIFGNKTPNNIIENSDFYTIHYSDELIYLNHIVYKISFNNFRRSSFNSEIIIYIKPNLMDLQ